MICWSLAACSPGSPGSPLGGLTLLLPAKERSQTAQSAQTGAISGVILVDDKPQAGIVVVIAERLGTPHTAVTDAQGRYYIDNLPVGRYTPAATGDGFDEATALGVDKRPALVQVEGGQESSAPAIRLQRHQPAPLPADLAAAVALSRTMAYSATTNFPPGAAAQVQTWQFERGGEVVDTLRVFLPLALGQEQKLPLLFMIFPSQVDGWQPVSVAFASQGYAFVAISPISQRRLDIEGHAQDARVALELARRGFLSPHIAAGRPILLAGSFSSAVAHRLLRDEEGKVAAWVTVGGIANAFTGAADFYAGRLEIPPQYLLAIPSLGLPSLQPLNFLRYSPVYDPAALPPTFIVHTRSDRVIPIDQAQQLEAALRSAGAPVDVYYYDDVSHYLQIGEDLTEAGADMFWRILSYVEAHVE